MGDVLQRIQEAQFTDRLHAERMLVSLVRKLFPLDVARAELRPLEVSLNSFNGFLTLGDGTQLFFKTHTESDTVIDEYYNAAMLAKAGYPVLQPIYSSTEVGRQFLVYELIVDPSVFDVAWAIECGDGRAMGALSDAQHAGDRQIQHIYRNTLGWQAADAAANAPVHQLFWHRLAGGRLERFLHETRAIGLPDGNFPLALVRSAQWTINGQRYEESLDELIGSAITLLNPAQPGPSVVGHGDAHNGNVFLREDLGTLLYFDPAFAGRHDPLLDLAKPLFHNVFASWMYFPAVKRNETSVQMRYQGGRFHVEHNYCLHPVRLMFLRSKIDNVLFPLLRELHRRGWLRPDWRRYLKAALLCCPLLTVNLADPLRMPPEISLLGLATTVEMGANSAGKRSLIDQALDDIQDRLPVM